MTARVNGADRKTQYIDSAKINFTLLPEDVKAPGTLTVTIVDLAQNIASEKPLTLEVKELPPV